MHKIYIYGELGAILRIGSMKPFIVFHVVCEGSSEQSFAKFLENHADEHDLNVRLVTYNVNGGGYTCCIKECKTIRKRHKRSNIIILVDTDRADGCKDYTAL